ncbi:hypothetical protein EIP91_003136 [Steccherinum ochraceum]|uniref:Transcription factor IIIC 90kDa subunit N-terminal domain-containing protein n=1 Tax=Steccherinum ochraceum TaxID=92696 RepID=A0A4R0RVR0_9APHY|nr:hypothetical protein EIP91_003136 [Steccherinum ochraceum]
MQVSFYAAMKNYLTGIWAKIGDYDASENALPPPNGTDAGLYKSLQAQVTSIAWSSQADFSTPAASWMDCSLLALGSRAGIICLARYASEPEAQKPLRHIATFSIADRWITQLAWSSWTSSQIGQCEAFLACGISDGSIAVVKVTQRLEENSDHIGLIKQYECSVSWETLHDKACEASTKGITSLHWIQTARPNPFLVFSSPGQVRIWSSAQDSSAWRGSRVIALRTVKTCMGSTSVATLSGFCYRRRRDALVVALADGSFHVISGFSSDPQLVFNSTPENAGFSAEALSAASRSVYLKVEERQPDRLDVNRIGGMMPFDDMSTYVWIHETALPTSFDYKHDAAHTSTFVVAKLSPVESDEALLSDITRATTILQILSVPNLDVPSSKWMLSPWSGELNTQFRSAFRKSLDAHLFGFDELHLQRMRWTIAQFCQDHVETTVEKQLFDAAATTIVDAICSFYVAFYIQRRSAY